MRAFRAFLLGVALPLLLVACEEPTAPRMGNVVPAEGEKQWGIAGAALPDSVAVRVLDVRGKPIPGKRVTWTIELGGGSITPSSTTDAQGLARAEWILGPSLDPFYRVAP